jgi:Putative peptidoglycan binding domain/LysM domain
MAGMYTVKQGDHLSSIAYQYGFADWKKIWNRPENAELKQKRQNPNVLFPGDQVFIPDKEGKDLSKPVDNQHAFKIPVVPLMLRIKLEKSYSKPIANTPCDLFVGTEATKLTSDGSGAIEQKIAKTATNARLIVHDKITVKGNSVPIDLDIPISIGHLDPVEEISGQVARLANLGYYREDPDKFDQDEFASSVEEFQCDQGLRLDGICGPRTQAKLKSIHGF